MNAQQQCAGAVLMVRPAAFDYNPQTADSNRLQQRAPVDAEPTPCDAGTLARAEFDAAVTALRGAGVEVCVIEDSVQPPKPDAVFPNNWVSWHAGGTVALYPMQAANRRLERRSEILEQVSARCGYTIRRLIDLTRHEAEGRYLEGTGSLVLDHVTRTAYACRSARTDEGLVRRWAAMLEYEPVVFDARDVQGAPYYHTNVMLSIGARVVVVAAEVIAAADRRRVLERLAASGRELIEIGADAVAGFAGNMLELAVRRPGEAPGTVFALSAQARLGLGVAYARLQSCTDATVVVPMPTIERLGGGSLRCMLAEVFV